MRVPIAVAFGALSVVAIPFLDIAETRANAQVLSTQPGNAPADALSRALQQRQQDKKLRSLQAGKRDRTKKLFLKRQSAFDQRRDLIEGEAKAKNELIRKLR